MWFIINRLSLIHRPARRYHLVAHTSGGPTRHRHRVTSSSQSPFSSTTCVTDTIGIPLHRDTHVFRPPCDPLELYKPAAREPSSKLHRPFKLHGCASTHDPLANLKSQRSTSMSDNQRWTFPDFPRRTDHPDTSGTDATARPRGEPTFQRFSQCASSVAPTAGAGLGPANGIHVDVCRCHRRQRTSAEVDAIGAALETGESWSSARC